MGKPEDEQPASVELDLVDILDECVDAPGYVVFVAAIDKNKKDGERPVINFKYRRYHFANVDLFKALEKFAQHAGDDVAKAEDHEQKPAPG